MIFGCLFPEYSNIFGRVNTGAHSIRFLNIAIVDLLLTVLVAYYISKMYKKRFTNVLLFLILLGIVLHRIFCVRTTVDKILFR